MCRCCDDSGFGLLDVSKKVFDGVLIKTSPMFLNRVTDWLGMRRQEKSGHVDQIRSQVEAGPELASANSTAPAIRNSLQMEHGRPRPSIVSGTPRGKRANAHAPLQADHNKVMNLRMRSNPRSNSAI